MVVFSGRVFADFHQFYIADVGGKLADLPLWTEDDFERRIVFSNGIVAFRTMQNQHVPVEVSFHTERPGNPSGAAHVVECSIESSGELMIAGCTDFAADAPRFSVKPGRLRVSYECVEPIQAIEIDGAENCEYFVKLWQSEDRTIVVKRKAASTGA